MMPVFNDVGQVKSTLAQRYLNVADVRAAAKRRLPRAIFEFIDRGAEDDLAVRNNRAGFEKINLYQRTMVDVSQRSVATSIFGINVGMPVAIAPTGFAGLCWHDGEIALAKAALPKRIPFTLATGALTSIERLAEVARPGEADLLWFQLNVWQRRDLSYQLMKRAWCAGFSTLIVTADTPVSSNREYNVRNGFVQPFALSPRLAVDVLRHPRWMTGVLGKYVMSTGMPRNVHFPEEYQQPDIGTLAERQAVMRCDSLQWDDLKELRRRWRGRLLVKGIAHPDDATCALTCGADGIIVSNHGGRIMDAAAAAIDMLPVIADVVGGRGAVLFDSGIRRGSDIVKALALGASMVLVGRPPLYGISVAGAVGAGHVLDILRNELDNTMAYTGCRTCAEIDEDLIS